MKTFTAILAIALSSGGLLKANETDVRKIGVANFAQCVADSKYGKKEQEALENLKNQMQSLVQDTEKNLREVASKLQDPEHLDGLSPEAEQELRVKFQTLQEEMAKYQNQYYQVLNQANMKMVQNMGGRIAAASEKVAKDHGFSFVINKDACFYFDQDVTSLVLSELDHNYDIENQEGNG